MPSLPVDPTDPDQVAQSFVGPAARTATGGQGSRLGPVGNVASNWRKNAPGPIDILGVNTWRTRNTILKGAWGGPDNATMAGYVFNPRSWTRFPSYGAFNPSNVGHMIGQSGSAEYTPFMASGPVNWIGRKVNKMGKDDTYYSGGLFGQISAANRIGPKGLFYKNASTDMKTLDSATSENIKRFSRLSNAPDTSTSDMWRTGAIDQGMGSQLSLDAGGLLNRRVGGFLYGVRNGDIGSGASEAFGGAAVKGAQWAGYGAPGEGMSRSGFRRAAQRGRQELLGTNASASDEELAAAAKMASRKYGASVGLDLLARGSTLLEGVGIVTTVWSLGKLSYNLAIKPLGEGIMHAAESFSAPFTKGLMGNGFRDNSVAATARARGVQAISASRLNARNVMGNEAVGIYQRFS